MKIYELYAAKVNKVELSIQAGCVASIAAKVEQLTGKKVTIQEPIQMQIKHPTQKEIACFVKKGLNCWVDSYSIFDDGGSLNATQRKFLLPFTFSNFKGHFESCIFQRSFLQFDDQKRREIAEDFTKERPFEKESDQELTKKLEGIGEDAGKRAVVPFIEASGLHPDIQKRLKMALLQDPPLDSLMNTLDLLPDQDIASIKKRKSEIADIFCREAIAALEAEKAKLLFGPTEKFETALQRMSQVSRRLQQAKEALEQAQNEGVQDLKSFIYRSSSKTC